MRMGVAELATANNPVEAGEGTRTPNLLITNQLLYQLSYASVMPEA